MVDLDLQIKSIHDKLQQLLRQKNMLQKENQKLTKELEKALTINQEREKSLQTIQQQMDVLKLGSASLNEEEKSALGKRIDVYLKEIDKCLALLNT
jgi:thiamine kinase-like enzyme